MLGSIEFDTIPSVGEMGQSYETIKRATPQQGHGSYVTGRAQTEYPNAGSRCKERPARLFFRVSAYYIKRNGVDSVASSSSRSICLPADWK